MEEQTPIQEQHYFDVVDTAEIEFILPQGKHSLFVLQLDQFVANIPDATEQAIAIVIGGINGKVNRKGDKSNILAIILKGVNGQYLYNPIEQAHAELPVKSQFVTLGFCTLKGEPITPSKDTPFLLSFTLCYLPVHH